MESTTSDKDIKDLQIMRERGFSEGALEGILSRATEGESPLETLARHFNEMDKPKVRSLRSLLERLDKADVRRVHLEDQLTAIRRQRGGSREVA